MKLIIGLGNPGAEYKNTRHNVGFFVLDQLAGDWAEKTKFKALISEVEIAGQKVILAKPNTFYNLSGEAVRALKDFYKLENGNILAIHDEIALPFGTIRTRGQGSDAGNNGIKSIIQHIGPDFARIRIGTANELLPQADAANFVLGKFNADEQSHLGELQKHVQVLVEKFVLSTLQPDTIVTI